MNRQEGMGEQARIQRWMRNPLPEDAQSRLEDAKELAELGEPAIPQLLKLSADKYYKVRQQAIYGLSRIGGPPAVSALMETANTADECSRWDAIMALGATKEPSAVPAVYAAMDDESEWIRKNAAWALERMGDVAAKELLPNLKNGKQAEKLRAADAIGKTKSSVALPALLDALKEEDHFIATAAAIALGKIGDTRATPHLLARMEGRGAERVRNWCAHAIADIGDTSAIPRMVSLMCLASKKSATTGFARELSIALLKMEPPPVSWVPELLETIALNSITSVGERGEVSDYIRWALQNMGEPAIHPLASALFSPQRRIVVHAGNAIVGICSPALPTLLELALNPENPIDVRKESISIIRRIGEVLNRRGDAHALPALVSLMGDTDKSIRRNAAAAMARFKADSKAISVLIEAALDAERIVRREAVTSLSNMLPAGWDDLLVLEGAIRSTQALQNKGGDRGDEMRSLRNTQYAWASHLSEKAERRHKRRNLQIPPRFRNPPKKFGRRNSEAQMNFAAGRKA